MAGVYSVSQVNAYIKNMFAQDFALNRISVKGEVSNCKYHTSGHIYFTLKDGLGAMQAVMFASRRKGLTFRLEEGQQVVVKGSIEVYERDGRYQLYASEITLDGTGDLFRRFEKLRNELEEMVFSIHGAAGSPAHAPGLRWKCPPRSLRITSSSRLTMSFGIYSVSAAQMDGRY